MNQLIGFVKRYNEAVGISKLTQKNMLSIIRELIRYDPFGKTRFEVSFKLQDRRIYHDARFLNMDGNAYSCKSQLYFLARLEIYKEIMRKRKSPRSLFDDIIKALEYISKRPMDLYFGADITDDNYLFAFWLIFGGVKRNGKVSFWPYDFEKTISRILTYIKCSPPKIIKGDILNFGFDINNKNVFYKLYYLIKDKDSYFTPFANTMKKINKGLSGYKYFYFSSHMYNKEGKCVKDKIFIEFLEDLRGGNTHTDKVIEQILGINNSRIDSSKISRIIKFIDGRISLISFEVDGTVTFYIRPD